MKIYLWKCCLDFILGWHIGGLAGLIFGTPRNDKYLLGLSYAYIGWWDIIITAIWVYGALIWHRAECLEWYQREKK